MKKAHSIAIDSSLQRPSLAEGVSILILILILIIRVKAPRRSICKCRQAKNNTKIPLILPLDNKNQQQNTFFKFIRTEVHPNFKKVLIPRPPRITIVRIYSSNSSELSVSSHSSSTVHRKVNTPRYSSLVTQLFHESSSSAFAKSWYIALISVKVA